MPIASKIAQQMSESSWIRRMFEEGLRLKAQFGDDRVFDFTLGNPDLDPPEGLVTRLRDLAANPPPRMHQYMPNAGFPEVRAEVARHASAASGIEIPMSHVVMCVGAGGGLNVILKTILDPGDEVVVFSPYFVEYLFYVDNHGGVPVVVPTGPRFDLDPDLLGEALTPRTKAVIVNSPNNPTGVVYGADTLGAVADVLREASVRFGRPIYLISDEPYRKILFGSTVCPHVFPIYDHSIVVYSHSKDLGLAGERIGHIAVHPGADGAQALVGGLTFSIRILGFVNAPAIMQLLVKDCLDLNIDSRIYERRVKFLYDALTGLGFEIVRPGGAFYMFPKSPVPDDREFVRECLRWNLLVVPGSGFGRPGHFRISLTVSDRVLVDSIPAWSAAARHYEMV